MLISKFPEGTSDYSQTKEIFKNMQQFGDITDIINI